MTLDETSPDGTGPDAASPAPGRRRGRPVSATSRAAVLEAAADLLEERGWNGFTVDEVARRSSVSKATIYKHWSGGYEIAVEAYGRRVTTAVPVRGDGDVVEELADQVRRLAELYAGPQGRTIAQLLAAGTGTATGPDLLRAKFFADRRAPTLALIDRGKAEGRLRADLDSELVVDLLFGGVVFRLFNGHPPLTATDAAALAEMGLRAIVSEPAED